MKKRQIFVAAAVLMGGSALVEMQTGWLFGNEAIAAGTGGGAAAIPLPMPGVMPGGARAGATAGGGGSFGMAASLAEIADEKPAAAAEGDSADTAIVDSGGGTESFTDPGGQLLVLGGGGIPMSRFAAGDGVMGNGMMGDGGGGAGGLGDQPQILAAASTGPVVSSVPEPASWISLITGLLLVGVNFRSRRGARTVAS